MLTKEIEFTAEDGLRLFAKSYGPQDASLTVVCLHGLTRNHKDFEPMIEALGDKCRFIAWDTRGRGKSERDPKAENYLNTTYARDVISMLDHLGLDKVALIGTSMGGLISMILMAMIPERILGVILNDIGPKLEQEGIDRIGGYVGDIKPFDSFEEVATRLEAVHKEAHPTFSQEDWLGFAKRTFTQRPDGKFIADYDPAIADSLKAVKVDDEGTKAAWELFDHMKQAPLLIIPGALSNLLKVETAHEMARRHGDADVAVVPNVGHAPLLNETEAIAAISRFLTRLDPGK